jgi:predicted GH43/DUF377 family glycosyl hydrolase
MNGTRVCGGRDPVRVYTHCLPKGFERPSAYYRLDAVDQGRILRHGDGPNGCDALMMRQAIVYESGGIYHLYYDACVSMSGYTHTCLATSRDLVRWDLKGPANRAGSSGEPDWAGVASPWFIFDGREWHMFYIGTNTRGKKGWEAFSTPYLTMKARSASLAGPWTKQYDVVPFRPQPGSYYSEHACPGHIVKSGDEYLMFFSPQAVCCGGLLRSLGIARTRDLNGPWTVDPEPVVPMTEQIENSSLYYEEANGTWFLFTNHIGSSAVSKGWDYTDAVWVYWSKDLNRWDPRHKAVVLDGKNCTWASENIGMPSVVKVGNRLAMFYDAREGAEISHVHRDIGLAWLDLPLIPPTMGCSA